MMRSNNATSSTTCDSHYSKSTPSQPYHKPLESQNVEEGYCGKHAGTMVGKVSSLLRPVRLQKKKCRRTIIVARLSLPTSPNSLCEARSSGLLPTEQPRVAIAITHVVIVFVSEPESVVTSVIYLFIFLHLLPCQRAAEHCNAGDCCMNSEVVYLSLPYLPPGTEHRNPILAFRTFLRQTMFLFFSFFFRFSNSSSLTLSAFNS